MDTAVVSLCLIGEANGESRGVRVLGMFRMWRLIRLVNTLLAKKDKEMDRTLDDWQADQQLLEEARVEISRLEDSIRRELDSKKRIETMLKSYKDEVETLNEALKIAALDIANAAGDQLLSDEEGEDEEFSGVSSESAPTKPPQKAPRTVFVKSDGSYALKGP